MFSTIFQSPQHNSGFGGNGNSRSTQNPWVQRLIFIIKECIDDPELTNQRLAVKMNCSEAQFYRLVKQHTNKSPNQLVRDIRLQTAFLLIESKKFKTVKEIASRVGFNRPDYFSRLFEERFGIRPVKQLK